MLNERVEIMIGHSSERATGYDLHQTPARVDHVAASRFGNAEIINIEPMHRIRERRFSPARLGIPG
jgi:hypothetical protein